jgi:16S rRNA (cytosine967-C5)-methyltransferase
MSVSAARKIAFDVLRRVEADGAFASDLLHAQLDRPGKLKPEDAALATELTLGVLRWQGLLDAIIQKHTGKPATRLDLQVRLALRLGLYQLRFLTRVPARAAVNESVEMVKRAGKRSAAGLVNAVLRKAAEAAQAPIDKLLPAKASPATRLAIQFSHPAWLVERWLKRFGELEAVALMEASNRPARLTCAIHDDGSTDAPVDALRDEELALERSGWLRNAVTVLDGNPASTRAFREGRISIQDEASQMVALLLDVQPGQRVLDLCAAPGGKTAILARAAGPKSMVVASDLYLHRLRALRGNLKRVGATDVRLAQLDAARPLPFSTWFDRILVDAPCSGTGTLARNPEIRWRLQPADLAELARRQAAILRAAFSVLAPGGRLVYATCSLEPEENEQVVEQALAVAADLCLISGRDALRRHLREGADANALFEARGYFRTLPHQHGTDGFFAAVLERVG